MFFKLILENANGDRVDMTATANQYMTSRVEGLNPPTGTISTSSYAGMDGSYLNNAFIEKRNVVISFEMRGVGVEARRHQLYKVVKPSRYIKIYYATAGIDVFAEGYVESCEVQNFEMLTTGQISILCPDIYWYSTTSVMAYYSQITGAFTFPFPTESNPEPFILGKYNTQNMMTIVNDGDEIGFTLVIEALEDARSPTHDKSVGGSGTGQHTKGNAADICCYGQDGQPISSKIVCQKAQDISFTGIANITAAYQYTHVDVRPNGKWYGDEVHSNGSVTDDFYKYFAADTADKHKETDTMKGIDVSVHNGDIDWGKVKTDGIDFAILRAGYGKLASQKDQKFEQNYKNAKAVNLPVGAYWYSYAMNENEARQEADVFLSVIKGKQFEMPVYFDLEEKKQFDLGKEKVSAIMRAFLEKVESAGYFTGLYGSASSLTTHTADDIKSRYTIWLAHWVNQTNYSGAYAIWQYSSKGKVAGINGNVDLDICYKDFPTVIKNKGLNGWAKSSTPAPDVLDTATVTITIGNDTYKGTLVKA